MSIPQLSASDIDFKNSITPLWTVLEAAHSKPRYSVPKTFQNCQFNKIQSQNGTSTATVTFPLNNVNTTALLENCMRINAIIDVTFTATNSTGFNAQALLVDGQVAPRMFPLNCATGNNTVDLGGSNPVITSCQEFFPQALLFANDAEDIGIAFSDACGQIDVGAYAVQNGINAGLIGTSRNALGSYLGGNLGAESRLGQTRILGYNNPAVLNNAAATAGLSFQVFEPIFSRCLTMNPLKTQCFIGCSNSSTVGITYTNFSNRVISFAPPIGWTNVQVQASFNSPPELYYNTYTLPPMTPLPEYSLYHIKGYNNQSYTNSAVGTSLQNQAPRQLTTVSFQDSLINRAVYIYATTEPVTSRLYNQSDYSGLEIVGLNIQYAGQQSQFSNLDNFQLYDLFHKRQGGVRQFAEFSYATIIQPTNGIALGDAIRNVVLGGSCLRIPSEMITGYDQSLYAVGSQISQNLQVTATVRWNGLSANAPTNVYLYVQCIDDSILAISNGMTQELAPAIFMSPDVIQKVRKEPVYITSDTAPMIGGSFWDNFAKGFKSVAEFAKPLAEAAIGGKMKKRGGNLVDQSDLRSKLLNL